MRFFNCASKAVIVLALFGLFGCSSLRAEDIDSQLRRTYGIPDEVPGPVVMIDRSLEGPGVYRTKNTTIYLRDEMYLGTEVEAHERLHHYYCAGAIPHERLVQVMTTYWSWR